jgi:hypothetical protein
MFQGARGGGTVVVTGLRSVPRAAVVHHRTRQTVPGQATIMLNHYLPIVEFLVN